jgi:translation initiation factor 3 subunit C
LTKQYTKAASVILKEGNVPRFYIRALYGLEDALKVSLENKNDKKMAGASAKALNSMKQKIKKYNKTFEKEIEEYRKVSARVHPILFAHVPLARASFKLLTLSF